MFRKLIVAVIMASAFLMPVAAHARPVLTGTLDLVLLDSPDAVANHGESYSWNATSPDSTDLHVDTDCYQGGVLVYHAMSYPTVFVSGDWAAGAADCKATAYYYDMAKRGRQVTTAIRDFAVEA